VSYLAPDQSLANTLQIAEITLSGSPAANGYFTFATLVDHTFTTAPTGLSSQTLTLPSGNYFIRATLDITRSSANDNYIFKLEADSSLIGQGGRTGLAFDKKADLAEAPFSSSSSISLKIKCESVEGTAPTLTTDSKCFIWRCDQ